MMFLTKIISKECMTIRIMRNKLFVTAAVSILLEISVFTPNSDRKICNLDLLKVK